MRFGILIVLLVVAILVGGLLALRSSGRAGMPDADVLRRAKERADKAGAAEEDEH